jgi:hypothetical protein
VPAILDIRCARRLLDQAARMEECSAGAEPKNRSVDPQFWPSWTATAVVPIIFVGQTLADYVLSPYLVGRRVNLLPVWMIFALFAFGHEFGFVGLLLAVRSPPRAACSCVSR